MTPKWLIQDVFADRENVPLLVDEIKKQGMEVKIASQDAHHHKSFLDMFEPTDCVITYGSLQFEGQVNREAKWIPGAYCTLANFDCTKYYPMYGDSLLNSNYIMLPYGELERQKEFLFDKLSIDRTVFIRPNRGNKVFTGKAIYKEDWNKEIGYLGYYQVKPEELCVVAEPRNVVDEYRFVVVDGEVIAGSQYKQDDVVVKEPGYPQEAFILANNLAKRYQPDRAFVLDICKTRAGNYYLLEINSFSAAGLYACDLEPVVREVSRIALAEWKEYQDDGN